MAEPENRMFCRLDGLTSAAREQKRIAALKERGLLTSEAIAVFDEATQSAARLLDAPICILGLMIQDQLQIKSAVGLSRVGLMNQLAQSRRLPRNDCFCAYVVDTHQVLVIHDTATNPVFASSLLVGYYGIRAYLGAPLLTADGQCLGTFAVMDCVPRYFSPKDVELLEITARWSLCEYERNRLLEQKRKSAVRHPPQLPTTFEYSKRWQPDLTTGSQDVSNSFSDCLSSARTIQFKLLTQLTQELRTPLTSIMGMASVLSRQIYGPLTGKQKEYLEIIHLSGQHLVSLVDEILTLGLFDETREQLKLTPVDIEMLSQQAINSLSEVAQRRQQQIRLSVEPGNRIWLLNKDKVRQMLYYLVFSVIHSADAGGEVRVHVSRKDETLMIAVWVSHPWLGEGLPQVYEETTESLLPSLSATTVISEALETPLGIIGKTGSSELASGAYLNSTEHLLSGTSVSTTLSLTQALYQTLGNNDTRESLGLLLSCHLAELHGGEIAVQGSLDTGYRYIITLPQLESIEERL